MRSSVAPVAAEAALHSAYRKHKLELGNWKKFDSNVFIVRRLVQHAERDIVFLHHFCPSTCLPVRPSYPGIVSKRMHVSSHVFDALVGALF